MSPYQYSLNNPIGFLDYNGKVVIAKDENARQAIVESVESDYRDNIGFKNDGTVYFKEQTGVSKMKDDLSNFSNYRALRVLVNSEKETFQVQSTDNVYILVRDVPSSSGVYNMLEFLSSGSFLPRSSSNEKQTTNDQINKITLSSKTFQSHLTSDNTVNTPARVLAHELYGHALLWYWKVYRSWTGGYSHLSKDPNSQSRQIIEKAETNVDK